MVAGSHVFLENSTKTVQPFQMAEQLMFYSLTP